MLSIIQPPISLLIGFGSCEAWQCDDLGHLGDPGDLAVANAGDVDLFVIKLDGSGSALWTHQSGTAGADCAYGVATDLSGSNVVVAGSTEGALHGQVSHC